MKHYHHMTLDIFVSTCHCSVLSVTSVHQQHRLEYIYSYVDLTDWFTHHITNSLSLITVWTERSASRLPRPSSLMTSLPRIRYRHSVTACWYFLAAHQQWDGPRESPDPHRWLRDTTGHRHTNTEKFPGVLTPRIWPSTPAPTWPWSNSWSGWCTWWTGWITWAG